MNTNIYGNYDNVADVEISTLKSNTIHDNVTLDKVVYNAKDPNDEKSLEHILLSFKKVDSKTSVSMYNHKILPLRRWDNMTDEAYTQSITDWNSFTKHIITKFDIDFEVLKAQTAASTSFAEYATKYIALITPKLDGRLFYLKLVEKNGYTNMPKYPKFLQPMSEGVCTLSFTAYENKQMLKTNAPASGEVVIDEIDDLDILD